MKKRKVGLKPIGKSIYNKGIVNVSKEESEYVFEIGKELTSDVAEAVAILMRMKRFGIWKLVTLFMKTSHQKNHYFG